MVPVSPLPISPAPSSLTPSGYSLMKLIVPRSALLLFVWSLLLLHVGTRAKLWAAEDLLTVERIFASREFQEESIDPIVWSKTGEAYFTLKKGDSNSVEQSLIKVDAASGNEQVVLSSATLLPPGESRPLTIDAFAFSPDEQRLLIFTNSRRVWRLHTRGDYWLLDLATGHWPTSEARRRRIAVDVDVRHILA